MIRRKNNVFKLDTPKTSLILYITDEGEAEYLYYGKRLKEFLNDYEKFVHAQRETKPSGLDGTRLYSSFGEIDPRRPAIACSFADNSFTARFRFKKASFTQKPDLAPLPSSYGEKTERFSTQTLCLEFLDEGTKLKLSLYYTVFADSDVIAVTTALYNGGKKEVRVKSLPSLQFELCDTGYSFVTFRGGWGDERNKKTTPLAGVGSISNESVSGLTSHASNPFVMLEKEGGVYAFNLVYSGNHKETAEEDIFGRTRVTIGLNDYMLEKRLAPAETFFTPEAVMTYAQNGDGISENMHAFVSNHIVRGKWKNKERPIVINNWEATYFNFNQDKIFAIAETASSLGVEMFVLDDGWFGKRDADNSSLGDWFDYEEKTGGISALAEGIRQKGLKFGIWVEPEMISENSELYKKHPEFAMKIPGKTPLRMRNQLVLNMADPKVQKYLIRVISAVIADTKASYVKWDYNRRITDCYGAGVFSGEYFLEYMKGFYTVLQKITEKFPNVLFEGCAGGGGRFDLGMLCFTPQIWTSDNTDARMRIKIQSSTSYGYPQSTMSCHVSASPNHQTLHASPIETRFNVAAFGVFGYETDMTKFTDEEKETVKKQIEFYKKWRKILQYGDMYRLGDYEKNKERGFICVSKDKSKAIAVVCADKQGVGIYNHALKMKGLSEDFVYQVNYRSQTDYAEEESFTAGGDALLCMDLPLNGLTTTCKAEEITANPVYTRILTFEKRKK
ncbi:MAG: alpha-galactosidase [Clostridia bacterium]|nr:alpha-galactosidase [Clostridia bacterium]